MCADATGDAPPDRHRRGAADAVVVGAAVRRAEVDAGAAVAQGPAPVGGGIRSLNVALRHLLDLYACVRPVRYYAGVPSPLREPEQVDVVIQLVAEPVTELGDDTRPFTALGYADRAPALRQQRIEARKGATLETLLTIVGQPEAERLLAMEQLRAQEKLALKAELRSYTTGLERQVTEFLAEVGAQVEALRRLAESRK